MKLKCSTSIHQLTDNLVYEQRLYNLMNEGMNSNIIAYQGYE